MRNRQQHRQIIEPVGSGQWPDAQLDVDDDEFAQAIAEGRRETVAA